jgi:apolipoprotein N-acyltransferase
MLALCAVMALWVFAFSPTPVAAATLPGLVAGLAIIEGAGSFRRAALYLALFGAVAIGFGYRWLAPTVQLFGELSLPASIGVLILFGVAGTVHALLFAGLYRLLFARGVRPHPIAAAVLLVACEALPIRFFPWTTGHGVVDVAPLRSLAEWGGLALVSFAALCFAIPVHEMLVWAFQRDDDAPARPRAAAVTLLVGIVLYGAGWWRHASVVAADARAGSRVRVAIVQADIGSLEKRRAERESAEEAKRSREAYERLTRRAAAEGADLIVWPETALMAPPKRTFTLFDPTTGRFRSPGAIRTELASIGFGWLEEVGKDRTLLLGCYEDERLAKSASGERRVVRFNAAMLREPGGEEWSLYRKVKLIPFGETMPLSGVFPGLSDKLPQNFRMEAGERGQPPLRWKAKDLTIAPFVCYEAILPEFVAERAGREAVDLLVNLTNDSWYGDTWEPHQHLNFSRFRAVEHRRPMVRATNTGISAFVDPAGEVVARLDYDREGVLVHDVPLVARGRTLFARAGGGVRWAAWIAALVALVWAFVRRGPTLTSE